MMSKTDENNKSFVYCSWDYILETAFARLDPLALIVSVGTVSCLVLFLATLVPLLQGDLAIAPKLALIGQYLLGFKVTWSGACLGLLQVGMGGFMLGYVGACLGNYGMISYARLVQRRAEAEAKRDLLDRL